MEFVNFEVKAEGKGKFILNVGGLVSNFLLDDLIKLKIIYVYILNSLRVWTK
jgi:hypothetical protein